MHSLKDIDWANWQPKDTATLTFVVQQQQVLLIRKKRGLGAGKINAPGGRLEKGESILDCAIREVQEELCITPVKPILTGDSLFQFTDGYSMHVYAYYATDFTGSPKETDEAIPLWFDINHIPYQEMWEDDRIWLPHFLEQRAFTGRYLFDGDRMLDQHFELLNECHNHL